MTVTDHAHTVDPELEAGLRREFAASTWFALAAATAQAHHELDELPPSHSPACDLARREALADRHLVLEQLLAEHTEQR